MTMMRFFSFACCAVLGLGCGRTELELAGGNGVGGSGPQPFCGDGVVDPGEGCDDANSIDDDGCGNDCVLTSCGNGVLDPAEECEGADLGGATCESLGFGPGTVTCTPACLLHVAGCDLCGDGVKNGSEQCDGADLGGATCQSLGFPSGDLSCTGSCFLNLIDCGNCGDGVLDAGEQCDDGAANEDRWALAYGLGLPATPDVMLRPFDNAQPALSFYSFFSASAHTGFEQVMTSRIYYYRNTQDGAMSLFFHHGIDLDTTGINQPPGQVDWVFDGFPPGAFIAHADDTFDELFPIGADGAEGHWVFNTNTDGGVVSQIQFPGDWTTQIEVDFSKGIDFFEIIDGTNIDITDLTGTNAITFFARSVPVGCRTDCTIPTCGDGSFDAGEVCDDGNNVGGDGCSADCSSLQ
jgi:cysteine-rich repeat protein